MQISDEMIEAALTAWFASPPSESDQGLSRSMRAALTAALALSGWRTIDSAPKNGTWIIATNGAEIFKTQGSHGHIWIPNGKGGHIPDPERKSFCWLASEFHSLTPWQPTHWQPLPAPPATAGKEG